MAVEVITVRGIGRGSPPETVGTGFTTLAGGWITGLNPAEGVGWNTVGTVPLVGARERIGVLGIGKATLNRGRASATPEEKLAGGERLSGEALGGVSGAYGIDTVGILGMLTTENGVWRAGVVALGTETWELAAIAALMANSF